MPRLRLEDLRDAVMTLRTDHPARKARPTSSEMHLPKAGLPPIVNRKTPQKHTMIQDVFNGRITGEMYILARRPNRSLWEPLKAGQYGQVFNQPVICRKGKKYIVHPSHYIKDWIG